MSLFKLKNMEMGLVDFTEVSQLKSEDTIWYDKELRWISRIFFKDVCLPCLRPDVEWKELVNTSVCLQCKMEKQYHQRCFKHKFKLKEKSLSIPVSASSVRWKSNRWKNKSPTLFHRKNVCLICRWNDSLDTSTDTNFSAQPSTTIQINSHNILICTCTGYILYCISKD